MLQLFPMISGDKFSRACKVNDLAADIRLVNRTSCFLLSDIVILIGDTNLDFLIF